MMFPELAAYIGKPETILRANPNHPFLLIHIGQLGPADVARLIGAYPNLNLIPAHDTTITVTKSRKPSTNMFEGRRLSPPWRALILRHPGRFVLGFDNVWARHRKKPYLPQVALWREALADLPDDLAHAVAHTNAERRWRLPPAK